MFKKCKAFFVAKVNWLSFACMCSILVFFCVLSERNCYSQFVDLTKRLNTGKCSLRMIKQQIGYQSGRDRKRKFFATKTTKQKVICLGLKSLQTANKIVGKSNKLCCSILEVKANDISDWRCRRISLYIIRWFIAMNLRRVECKEKKNLHKQI